jgi:hypothetical protein
LPWLFPGAPLFPDRSAATAGESTYFGAWERETTGSWRGNQLTPRNLTFMCPGFLVGWIFSNITAVEGRLIIWFVLVELKRTLQTSRDRRQASRLSGLQSNSRSPSHDLPGIHNEPE